MIQSPISYFNDACNYLIKIEGGYVNDPDDRGGETKYGISKRSYPDLDIKNLTVEEAKSIYLQDWWAKEYDLIPKTIAIKTFITAVHTGSHKTIRLLQGSVNNCSLQRIELDGYIGPVTVNAINKIIETRMLLSYFKLAIVDYYTDLCDVYPSDIKYLKGWIRRALV